MSRCKVITPEEVIAKIQNFKGSPEEKRNFVHRLIYADKEPASIRLLRMKIERRQRLLLERAKLRTKMRANNI